MKISNFIKTECGIEKYNVLKERRGILNRLRLFWFILIASLRDFNK